MNIIFFNRSFYPDKEATGQFLTELCDDLTLYGHKVTVICGIPYQGQDYKKIFLIKKGNYKNINIIRGWGTRLPKHVLFFRLINLGTYFLSALFSIFLIKKKPDLIIAQTDPPLSCLLGIISARFFKAKFVYSIKDIYPDIGILTGKLKNLFLIFILNLSNNFAYKIADKIIVISHDMKKRITEKGINEKKIEVAYDWADIGNIIPVKKEENTFISNNNLKNKFIVLYSGNLGLTQGLEKVINVASLLKENLDILFLFIGDGVNKKNLEEEVEKLNLRNVLFLPYQEKENLKYSLSSADIHLITQEPGLGGFMLPSKIYGILASGVTFIASVDKDSDIANLVNQYNCGYIADLNNQEEFKNKILEIKNNNEENLLMGKICRKLAEEKFSRLSCTKHFHNIITS